MRLLKALQDDGVNPPVDTVILESKNTTQRMPLAMFEIPAFGEWFRGMEAVCAMAFLGWSPMRAGSTVLLVRLR